MNVSVFVSTFLAASIEVIEMVAIIVAGAPVNEEQAKAVPQTGKAKQVFATLFEKLAASKTAAK